MKKCTYCAEEIQDEAVKCKHCGEFLIGRPSKKPSEKWYFKPFGLVIAFLCVGPLALPLVWVHPRLSRNTKIIINVVAIILSYVLGVAVFRSLKIIISHYQQVQQAFELL